MINEAYFSRKVMQMLRVNSASDGLLPGAVPFKHWESIGAGVPDISVSWNGWTTWLETKFLRANGGIIARGNQAITIRALSTQTSCYYLIFQEFPKETQIVHPTTMSLGTSQYVILEKRDGYDFKFPVEFIYELHTQLNLNRPERS